MAQTIQIETPDIGERQAMVVPSVGGALLLVRTKTRIHACSAVCPHQNRSLKEAIVRGESIICPWHGALFDLSDGRSLSAMTTNALTVFPCEEIDGSLRITLAD